MTFFAGAENVLVKAIDGWICICSDVDWLEGIEDAAFAGFAPFRPGGVNSATSEIFLVVFSCSVVTAIGRTRSPRWWWRGRPQVAGAAPHSERRGFASMSG